MALYTYHHDAPAITAAGKQWVNRCLVGDRSMFGEEEISTRGNFDELEKWFVLRPDAGEGSFYEKLEIQMAEAPPDARKLMAEVLWALFLFPSNITEDTKRNGILRVWTWSGDLLDPEHPMLSDAVLDGIGSAGMGVNTNRWREINYIIGLGQAVKGVRPPQRAELFSDYDRFMGWIDEVPMDGNRQFRHMLRYFLFPERVERMSTNSDRRKVLIAFGVATRREMTKWSDRQLDDAMLRLRGEQEAQYGTTELDFYLEPLRSRWLSGNDPDPAEDEENDDPVQVAEPEAAYPRKPASARNLILYGPPGTGKTYRLQQLFAQYTDQPADLDRTTWEMQLVSRYGWRAVIAAALADLAQPSKVIGLEAHRLVQAKAKQRKRTNVRSTLWGYMQSHTPLEITSVKVADRRAPFVFVKSDDSDWSVVADWQDVDAEAAELFDAWKAGPAKEARPARRYRLVTFHPSYTYEDFVIGLRPVVVDDSSGAAGTGFRMVDGVLKQICAEARGNPGKQYALFIDEINRANIAKVFGELITLIEPDKRARYDAEGHLVGGLEVQLPGTGSDEGDNELFGVPENMDIYGTMNTADRSIALLDIALRRRFEFEEVGPDYRVLDRRVEGVDLGKLLATINDRLEFLADRDRRIGHAYFTKVASLNDLRVAFRRQVIPLLQEFFFDDWSRIEMVLITHGAGSTFIRREELQTSRLFGDQLDTGSNQRYRYVVTPDQTWTSEAFQAIYAGDGAPG